MPMANQKVFFISAHDYRSPRRANIHFIADEFVKRQASLKFFSLRYSKLSRRTQDPRLSLDHLANRVADHQGVACFLWKTPIHPFNTHRKYLEPLESLAYRLYVSQAPEFFTQGVREADIVVIESGLGATFIRKVRDLNPKAQIIYIASDGLSTINVSQYVKDCLKRDAGLMDVIRIPSRAMLDEIAPAANVFLIPHGVDTDLVKTDQPSPYEPDTLNAVSVGSMLFDKAFIMQAARLHPQIRFHVIGCGNHSAEGYPDNVQVYGEMPHRDVLPYIKHADIGLAPYVPERVPPYLADTSMKLIQYDLFGVPAVCPKQVQGSYGNRFAYRDAEDEAGIRAAFGNALAAERKTDKDYISWSGVLDRLLAPEQYPDIALNAADSSGLPASAEPAVAQ